MEVDRMALDAAAKGRVHESRARFEYALRLDPSFHQARFNYAVALAREGLPEQALSQYFWLRGAGAEDRSKPYLNLLRIIELSYGSKGQEWLAEACRREAERVRAQAGT
jgi:tetratricopeptide (TPR) repeat protein